ncbi:hypothetical protein GGR57DRAFT_515395 [Xylariaceae sp. FL1272]|nr:hypothetical protein GGR57DRAFT_515395 [Xylariaceae sp. FL1272]
MADDPIKYLGLTCTSGGDFYICQDSEVRFLGCCDVDPCGDNGGKCPSSSLHPGSFNTTHYDEIESQNCASSNALWYTCSGGPTFLGCCSSNPCSNEGICPDENLDEAVLNDDESKASAFLTKATTSTTSFFASSTSASVSTSASNTPNLSSSTTSSTPSPTVSTGSSSMSNTQKSHKSPIAAIAGGTVAGIFVLLVLLSCLFRYRRRKRDIERSIQPEGAQASSPRLPWSPYQDSFRGTPKSILPSPPITPGSPAFMTTKPDHHKGISESLMSSIANLKRSSATKEKYSSHHPTPYNQESERRNWIQEEVQSPEMIHTAAELEDPTPSRFLHHRSLHEGVYFEVEGSTPGPRHQSRQMSYELQAENI